MDGVMTQATDFFDVVVHSLTREAEGVLSLGLRDPEGRELPEWVPGAHIDVMLPGDILRQYSLCSRTEDRRDWRIGVLHEPAGRGGSVAVHRRVRPGDILRARRPRNNFTLEDAESYLFIAGGIGITPLLSMIREAGRRGIPWRVLYLGKTREGMAFREEIGAEGGELIVHSSADSGRFPLAEVMSAPEPGARVYACGPPELLAALGEFAAHWAEPGRYHQERFLADPASGSPAGSASGAAEDHEFDVEIRDGSRIRVIPGLSVLESLEAAGITPPSSCREGICGTCETAVLSGKIDHRDSLLSDDERDAQDTMMICVSRCLGDRLVLDL